MKIGENERTIKRVISKWKTAKERGTKRQTSINGEMPHSPEHGTLGSRFGTLRKFLIYALKKSESFRNKKASRQGPDNGAVRLCRIGAPYSRLVVPANFPRELSDNSQPARRTT